jgi:hypothetical protein
MRSITVNINGLHREEQPEHRIYFVSGAMRKVER